MFHSNIKFNYLFIRIINKNSCFLQTTSIINIENNKKIDYYKIISNKITKIKHNLINLKTIYISLDATNSLNFNEWENLLKLLQPLTKNIVEYNIEIHGHVSLNLFLLWKKYGVNRLVWRIFSFNNYLINLNNCHHITNYKSLILLAKNYGFLNNAVDLVYNLKQQTKHDINKDLQIIEQLKINHLNYYEQNQENVYLKINYKWLVKNILKMGYKIYEKNNFILTNKDKSYHQKSYWLLQNYYAIGLQTTSFVNFKSEYLIYENKYKMQINYPKIINLTKQEYYELLLINGLSLVSGINLKISHNYKAYSYFKNNINKLIKENKLIINKNYLFCNKNYLNILDKILQKILSK